MSTSCRGAVRVTLDEIKHTSSDESFYSAAEIVDSTESANAERWCTSINSVYHPVLFMILDEIFPTPHFSFFVACAPPGLLGYTYYMYEY